MDWEYEERVVSIVRGGKGWGDECEEIFEFKQHLELGEEEEEAGLGLAHEKLGLGWVLWKENERVQQHQIITLLEQIASHYSVYTGAVRDWTHYIVQYWGVVKVEEEQGRPWHHHLSSSHLPFAMGNGLSKGSCWYRKLCRGHVYVVDIELGDDNDDRQVIGGVGRAYRNKRPESTPDLRLYSTHEYPMRDEAARCGFRGYLALPLFDVRTNQCRGVLEILSRDGIMSSELLSRLDGSLQIAGFRSTHTFISISDFTTTIQTESEISEILKLVMTTVPRLYLAQVYVPCKQCTDLRCLETAYFIEGDYMDEETHDYLRACHFLQMNVSSFHSYTCDVSSICKNPLAHYAQRARMSHSFAISLHNTNHSSYTIRFCLVHPKSGQDDSVQLLLRIVEMNLKTFKFVSEGEVSQKHDATATATACESIESLHEMKVIFSESNFKTYLEETVDSCSLQPSSAGWIFCIPAVDFQNEPVSFTIKEKVEKFMKNVVVDRRAGHWIVQFWAPKMADDRCYLQTSDQPFAVGCLAKGIASFRKKCLKHYYPVDDQAKEEELGPPGRVFRNGNLEISPHLLCYTSKEFPIINYALHCCSSPGGYFALPIFDVDDDDDELNHKCVGVLEFLGFLYHYLEVILRELKAAKLYSTPRTQIESRFLAIDELPIQTINCRKVALTEINSALKLMCNNIPQLHMTNVWVSYGECAATSVSSLELALSVRDSYDLGKFMPTYQVHWIHIKSRKGMVGMVLASEDKSCFCPSLSEFGIADQPLSHYEMSERRDVCFAICLLSSHTGDLVYVVEFFLYHGPATHEYVRSFLNFLLPIMKHELRSFKLACGKELGEELVVEVVEFSDANKLDSSASEQPQVMFPIKFKSVQYNQEEHQHAQEQQTEERSVVASDSNTRERGKRKTSLHLSLEDLKQHFGKKLKDVALELGVGRSTIKRACRDYGIDRWPSKGKLKRNPSLFEKQSGGVSQLDTNTESIRRLIVEEEAEKVMIKVIYGEDIIKFELRAPLGLTKLTKEVAARLNLEMNTFKLKYEDEDGDEILLTNDVDLQLCHKTQITMGKAYIQLYVR